MRSPSYFVDTTGQPTLGVGLCGRCSAKLPLAELYSDPNSPGLMVCINDLDVLDPWRLPARESENINLPFVRPDLTLTPGTNPPVRDVLGLRLITDKGQALLDSNGNYIDAVVPTTPYDVP